MGMTIEKAISWLLSIAEHEGDDIPIYDTDVEAIKMAIETMCKYQKIKEVMDDYFHNDRALKSAVIKDIERIIEDGNDY